MTADVCGWCGGKGRVPAHWYGAKKTCPECGGSGSKPVANPRIPDGEDS